MLIIIISVIAKHGPAPVAVTTIAVKPGTLVNKLPENGTLSLPQTATIAAQTASTIERILVREGGRVRAGDLLMKLDDRAVSAKVSADEAAEAQALATLKKAEQTAAVAGDSNVQSVAQAQENLLSAQSQLQSDINAKREGQVSAAGFASLGLSGQSQLAQQVSQLKDTETNLRTAREQYDGDVALYKMDAIAHLQLNRDQATYEQAQAAYDSALRQYTLTKQQLNDSVGQQDAKIAADRHAVDSARAALSAAQIQAGQNTAAVDVASAQAGEASATAQLQ
ncbi:MAG: biotin/lipoyl-binding protein [Candidatus Eremiobacterales bacterium]